MTSRRPNCAFAAGDDCEACLVHVLKRTSRPEAYLVER